MEAKRELRKRIRQIRGRMTRAALHEAGTAIAARVLERREVRKADTVFCYLSVRREVPTGPLLQGLQALGCRVVVPRVDDTRMEARLLQEPLVEGVMGIPTSDGPVMHDVDVAICPGLAFDMSGGRLGYGGGYYDAWLDRHPCHRIGICVEEAVLEAVPREAHDQLLDLVITPTRTVRTRPIRVVAGAWIRDGRVLAARCGPGHPRAGEWELPGGKVEPGETDAQALHRELAEELRLDVQVVEPRLGASRIAHRGEPLEIVAYEVHDPTSDPTLTEHDAVRWLTADQLQDVDWVAGDRAFINALRARLAIF